MHLIALRSVIWLLRVISNVKLHCKLCCVLNEAKCSTPGFSTLGLGRTDYAILETLSWLYSWHKNSAASNTTTLTNGLCWKSSFSNVAFCRMHPIRVILYLVILLNHNAWEDMENPERFRTCFSPPTFKCCVTLTSSNYTHYRFSINFLKHCYCKMSAGYSKPCVWFICLS